MTTPPRWIPTHAPRLRDTLDAFSVRTATATNSLGSPLTKRFRACLAAADLFWVSGPMTDLVLDASQDVPSWDWADRPTDNGMMLFETPLPTMSGNLITKKGGRQSLEVPVAGIVWTREVEDAATISILFRASDVPAAQRSELFLHAGDLADLLTVNVPLPPPGTPVEIDSAKLQDATGADRPATPRTRAMLAFLSAAWNLMATPTVATDELVEFTADGRRRPTPKDSRKARRSQVRLLDLRPLRHAITDHDEATGRKLTVRFMVRGHWRNQAWGPDRALRRLTYIAPHIKGPADAPLAHTEVVRTWRR